MINKVFDALTLTLHKEFPNSQIFVDEAVQGFNAGDFIVSLFSLTRIPVQSKFTKVTAVFSVSYYPTEKNEDSYFVAERVLEILELLPIGNGILLRGCQDGVSPQRSKQSFGRSTWIKGIMKLNFRYSYLVAEELNAESMEELEYEEK